MGIGKPEERFPMLNRLNHRTLVAALTLAASMAATPLVAQAQQDAPPSAATDSPTQPAPAPQPYQVQPQPQPQPQPYYYQPQPQPQPYYYRPMRRRRPQIVGYRTEEREVRSLWIPGLITLGVGYLLDVIGTPVANSISNDRPESDEEDAMAWALIPIAGPIIQLGIGAPHPALPITSGLLQLGGLTMFIAGLTMREEARVPIYEGDADDPTRRVDVQAVPLPGGGQVNVTLTHL